MYVNCECVESSMNAEHLIRRLDQDHVQLAENPWGPSWRTQPGLKVPTNSLTLTPQEPSFLSPPLRSGKLWWLYQIVDMTLCQFQDVILESMAASTSCLLELLLRGKPAPRKSLTILRTPYWKPKQPCGEESDPQPQLSCHPSPVTTPGQEAAFR